MSERTDDEYTKALHGPADPQHVADFDEAEEKVRKATVVERSQAAARADARRKISRR